MAKASYVEKLEVILELCFQNYSTHYLSNPETEFELDPSNLPEEIQPTRMDLNE